MEKISEEMAEAELQRQILAMQEAQNPRLKIERLETRIKQLESAATKALSAYDELASGKLVKGHFYRSMAALRTVLNLK